MIDQTETKPVKPGMKGGKSNAEINAELRVKAAKQAAKKRASEAKTPAQAAAELARGESLAPSVQPGEVLVRVTRRGDGRISTGVHIAGIGEAHYEKDEEFITTEEIAKDLSVGPDDREPRDWVEIIG